LRDFLYIISLEFSEIRLYNIPNYPANFVVQNWH
jgi:hypothetical protein